MAKFLNPHGREVTADEALINGRLRPNYREIMTDGESIDCGGLHLFNMDGARFVEPAKGRMFIMDAPKVDETSIDAALREVIATLAKGQGITAAEYLAKTPLADIQKLAAETAQKVLESLSGKGVASKLADERTKGMADAKAFSAARYAGAAMIEAADGENPPQPSMGAPSGVDATATIRSLRYQ